MARRNQIYLGLIAGLFLGPILTCVFNNRSVDWPGTVRGILFGGLLVWSVQRLWAWRRCHRDKQEMSGKVKIIAAIVIVGVCQILFLAFSIERGLKPHGIGVWIAPVIMLGMAATLIWKGLKFTAI